MNKRNLFRIGKAMLLCLVVKSSWAQMTSRVTEHIGLPPSVEVRDQNHQLYLSDGTNLYLSNTYITKTTAGSQQVLFNKQISVNGAVFRAEKAVENNAIITLIGPDGVAAMDLQGNVLWAKNYGFDFSDISLSHHGFVTIAGYFQDGQQVTFEAIEIDDYNGSIIQRQRHQIFVTSPNTNYFINDFIKTSQGYFASVTSHAYEHYTISLDPDLHLLKAVSQNIAGSNYGHRLEIRSLKEAKDGGIYFLGEVSGTYPNMTGDELICGKMDYNHVVTHNKLLLPNHEITWAPEYEIANNTARIVETTNPLPYYHEGVTAYVNDAVTFCARLEYGGLPSNEWIMLFQFDEHFFLMNYATRIRIKASTMGIHPRPNDNIHLFATNFDNGSMFEYNLPTDMDGCYMEQFPTYLTTLSIYPSNIDFFPTEQELFINEMDFQVNDQEITSNLWCQTSHEKSLAFDETIDEKGGDYTVFPNPSNGEFYVKNNSDKCKVEVFDLSGKEIPFTTSKEGGMLKIEGLKSGVYLLRLNDEDDVFLERIIVD